MLHSQTSTQKHAHTYRCVHAHRPGGGTERLHKHQDAQKNRKKQRESKGRESKTKPVHPCSGAVGDTPRSEPPSDLPFNGTLGKLGLPAQCLLLQKKANHPNLRMVLSDSVRRFCCCLPVCRLGTGGPGAQPLLGQRSGAGAGQ